MFSKSSVVDSSTEATVTALKQIKEKLLMVQNHIKGNLRQPFSMIYALRSNICKSQRQTQINCWSTKSAAPLKTVVGL